MSLEQLLRQRRSDRLTQAATELEGMGYRALAGFLRDLADGVRQPPEPDQEPIRRNARWLNGLR